MATVYREDELPEGLVPPMRLNKASRPEDWWAPVPELVTTECKAPESWSSLPTDQSDSAEPMSSLGRLNNTDNGTCSFSSLFGRNKDGPRTMPKNETEVFEAYHVLPSTQCVNTVNFTVARDLLDKGVHWPNPGFVNNGSYFKTEKYYDLPGPTLEDTLQDYIRQSEDWCSMMAADFNNSLLNMSLLAKPTAICTEGVDMYVYVRSCFIAEEMYPDITMDPGLLLVHVALDLLREDNTTSPCLSALDEKVEMLNKYVLLALLAGYTGCVLLLAGVTL